MSDALVNGLLLGKLPGNKEWVTYLIELTSSHFHIYDESTGNSLRSLEINPSDMCGVDSKARKGEYKFYLMRSGDGRYVFKTFNEKVRDDWIMKLTRVINKLSLMRIQGFEAPTANTLSPESVDSLSMMPKKFDVPSIPPLSKRSTLPHEGGSGRLLSALDTPLPPVPGDSPRSSIISTDSGIGASEGGVFSRSHNHRSGSSSVPSSGGGTFKRPTSSSDSGKFGRSIIEVNDEEDGFNYSKCKWFWGCMSRQDCEKKLQTEGKVGNFAIRINANGHYIMSLWRVDGVRHHKILQHNNMFLFDKAAVSAKGESLVDLLDNYLKTCVKDKKIEPFGGALYEHYNYAWNPPEFDMLILQQRLKEQKKMREDSAKKKTPRQREQYTPVEVDTTSVGQLKIADSTDSESSGEGSFQRQPQDVRRKALPIPPTKPRPSHSSSTSENESANVTPTRKQLPSNASKVALEPPKAKPLPPTPIKDIEKSAADLRKNQPLPPTPPSAGESSPSTQSQNQVQLDTTKSKRQKGGRGKQELFGAALLKEMAAKKSPSASKRPPPVASKTKWNETQERELTKSDQPEAPTYANLQVNQATPYQNVGFGPDAETTGKTGVTTQQDSVYENFTQARGTRTNTRVSPSTRPKPGEFRLHSGSHANGTEATYQNIRSKVPSKR